MDQLIPILTLLCAMLAVYLQYHSSGRDTQQRLVSQVRRVLGSAGRVVTYVVILSIFIMSLTGIYLFWTSSDPIRRSEVVMVIFHIINAFMYGYLSLSIPFNAIRERRSQNIVTTDLS